jgi:alpha-ketoglutarate-dependent taurine dioxygenase
MNNDQGKRVSRVGLRGPGSVRREAVSVDSGTLVRVEAAPGGTSLPLILQAAAEDVDLVSWAEANRAFIADELAEHGALLFRGFHGTDLTGFDRFIRTVSGELLAYSERSSPRSQVEGRIYTSTEYPADQTIFLHNENSYAHTWPLKVFFLCSTPPQQGGATPVADCRQVFASIDPGIRQRFIEKGVTYVRNFSEEVGLSWQTVFGTTDPDEVAVRCRAAGYDVEWTGPGRLRTKRVGPAAVAHPRSREWTWFNHATFFHVTTLEPNLRDALLAQYAEEDLPSNTYYGDGSPIEPAVLDHLRGAYEGAKVRLPWQAGDVLMLDNMLVAHGREPFVGPRQIRVGMSEPCTIDDL